MVQSGEHSYSTGWYYSTKSKEQIDDFGDLQTFREIGVTKDPANIRTNLDSPRRIYMSCIFQRSYAKCLQVLKLKYEKDCVQLRCTVDGH